MVMHLRETGYWQKESICEQLDKFLDKEIERRLFSLAVQENQTTKQEASNNSWPLGLGGTKVELTN